MESTEAMSSLLSSWDIPEDVVRRFHDQKIPLQMTLFGYLVPPKGRLSKKHKFSTAEAIEGLIVQTHNAGDIEDVIKKQVDKAKSRNTTAQPYVLLPGSLSKYNALYIVIDEYDTTSYGRRGGTGIDRPTSVTAKYLSPTPAFKSSSIPVLAERPKDDTISTIANRYAGFSKLDKKDYEKTPSKYEKKDYGKLSVPTLSANRSREVSPVSTSSKYSLSRSSRHLSPDIRSPKNVKDKSRDASSADREKDIPSKTDKSPSYNNSLSSYKLYPRTSNYSRGSSRAELKPDITVSRYSIANRLSSSSYLRSPPTVKRTSVSPVSNMEPQNGQKSETEKSISPVPQKSPQYQIENEPNGKEIIIDDDSNVTEIINVITRHTSPTPPGSSAYVRSRRADMAKTIEKSISRPKKKPDMIDKEIQSDRLDDTSRSSRFGSTPRTGVSHWTYYTPSPNSYTGYAGRYSTNYSNLRESSGMCYNDRSSRSRSTEPQPKEPSNLNSNAECVREKDNTRVSPLNKILESNRASPLHSSNLYNNSNELDQENVAYEPSNEENTSEIIINVNLKLKKTNNPMTLTSTELVSPEITITNSQLPPQPPKPEGPAKLKKIKSRKSSTDSTFDSSNKKKIVKKRSKSLSSNESDKESEASDKPKDSKSNSPSKSKSNIKTGISKLKHSKSRESKSPESVSTLSTQSSISEDDSISKSKTQETSRTSADETSIPTDEGSAKQHSPLSSQKNEGGAEEAKSFLVRALAPVTNLFKKHDITSESKSRPETSTSESTGKDITNLVTESDRTSKSRSSTNNIIASNDDNLVQLKGIRHIESGERAWWMDPDGSKKSNYEEHTPSDKIYQKQNKHIESGERPWWLESNSENKGNGKGQTSHTKSNEVSDPNVPFRAPKFEDEKPWWLDSNSNVPEGIERLTPPRKSSSESDKSEKYNFFKVRHIESGEKKDWWLTSNENSSKSSKSNNQNSVSKSGSDSKSFPLRRIRHVESGERPWWLSSDNNIPEGIEKLPTPPTQAHESESSDSEELHMYMPPGQIPPFPLQLADNEPLGARRSPEGLETPLVNEDYRSRNSTFENDRQFRRRNSGFLDQKEKYISRYTDIDDILGTSGQIYSPFMDSILARRTGQIPLEDDECEEIDPTQVRIHDSTAQMPVITKLRGRGEIADYREGDQLDDATLQVFKDGDYGPYLDLDSTLGEQDEELEGLQDNRKNGLVLRTQLSVRVHAIIDRLLHSQGRELRRALFTLKQILQSDKDLVHEFIANKGLDCLMQVSSMADHNYLDYILRALGQILLYVDGMHGVMAHKRCIQWLYSLIASKFRHVVKTALKLLLVFVEYTDKNCLLLIDAVQTVDHAAGRPAWYNAMKILQDFDASDTELLIYATTLINRCLNNVPDRDTYYDQVDSLQDQGMDDIIQLYMSKQGTDLDLLRQLQIFEAVLLYEDGDESGTALKQLDDSVINSVRRRSLKFNDNAERRKSKKQKHKEKAKSSITTHTVPDMNSNKTQKYPPTVDHKEKSTKDKEELTAALRRRRDRFARQHIQIQQQELLNNSSGSICNGLFVNNCNGNLNNGNHLSLSNRHGNNPDGLFCYPTTNGVYTNGITKGLDVSPIGKNGINGINGYCGEEPCLANINHNINIDVIKNDNQRYTSGLKQRIQNGTLGHSITAVDAITVMRQKQIESPEVKNDRGIILNREHSIKDLAQRLTTPISPTTEEKPLRVSDMAGIVSKAKEELAKSQSKEVIKSPTIDLAPKVHEIKVSENDLHWEELKKGCLNREFHLCDLDFSDLKQDSDDDIGSPAVSAVGGPPPPPPGIFPILGNPPPPMPATFPLYKSPVPAPPPKPPTSSEFSNDSDSSLIKKNKKTVKLFWREIQENPVPILMRSKVGGLIWDQLPQVTLDTKMLEHLFESKSNDLIIKEKLMEPKRNLILDAKRSNAINIAMKKLPTPQTIKAAIMKMDATVIGREGIEKLLTMLPTEEEKVKIQEAQYANPDLPLGSAEQFLLTLASINELPSRLKLWVFKLDFDNLEKEIAEPLMDLKQGIELLKVNMTFKVILSTLRSVGSFLNGNQVKGFRLEYLSKVMEVKDTVHKHPLLYHVCEMIIEKFSESTDLFSEVGPVIRASKVDFDMLSANIKKLEADCKASWDHMKRVAKHDGSQIFKTKINEFLTDAAERIILLCVIEKRVLCRYNKFLLYLGVPPFELSKTKPTEFLKVIAEFALEYRTTRERVLQQLEKRANHRERNKTRGKMIIDVGNYATKTTSASTADSALKELLKADPDTDSLTKSRRKSSQPTPKRPVINGDVSADDEIIESLVRAATTKRRTTPRDRRRNRLSDQKSLNRTLDGT